MCSSPAATTMTMMTPAKVRSYPLVDASNHHHHHQQQHSTKLLEEEEDEDVSLGSSSSSIVPSLLKLSSSSLLSSSHTNTTATKTATTMATKTKTTKSVQFSTLTVREYVVCLAEDTCVPSTYGPPIGLSWDVQSEYTCPINIDQYEYENQTHQNQRSIPPSGHDDEEEKDEEGEEEEEEISSNLPHPGRSNSSSSSSSSRKSSSSSSSSRRSQPQSQLKMTPIERQQLLMSNGYSRDDIQKATERSNRDRLKRLGTIRKIQRRERQKQWIQDTKQTITNVWMKIRNKRTVVD